MKLLIALLGLTMSLPAQTRNNALGAENESTGNIMSVANNELSLQGNPSGLAFADTGSCISISTLHYSGFAEFNKYNVTFLTPLKKYHFGLSVNRVGTSEFNEHNIYLGFAHKIRSISLGGSLSYQQRYAEGYSSKRVLSIDIGGTIRISPKLIIGTYITNVNQERWTRYATDVLPTLMAVGVKYTVLKNVAILSEIEKYTLHKSNLKVGLSYQTNRWLILNMGIHTTTKRIFTGIGLNRRNMYIWCSYSYNYYLLSGIQITLKYTFK